MHLKKLIQKFNARSGNEINERACVKSLLTNVRACLHYNFNTSCFCFFSNFTVYCCLLVFSILLSLRVSGVITWNYAAVFIPIWVWNAFVLCGVVVGVVFWIKKKSLRSEVITLTE